MNTIAPSRVAEVKSEFGKLIIEDWQGQRFLRFDSEARQAMMSLAAPYKLVSMPLQYTLAPLLLQQTWQNSGPTNTLLAGIGGGDLIRFFQHYLPESKMTAVDHDATMLKLAQTYFKLPKESKNCHYLIEDAAVLMQRLAIDENKNRQNLIVIDLHLEIGMPDFLNTASFFETCRTNLSPHGVLALNILPRDKSHLIQIMKIIRTVFDRKCLYAAIPNHDNIVIYAFNHFPLNNVSFEEIERNCVNLSKHFDIDFTNIWKNMRTLNPVLTNTQSKFFLSDILPQ